MVRQMFLPYFSKERGPPRIRMQLMGLKRRRFFKIVAANQRDPRDGKHMEVLGSYMPRPHSGVKEIRLRFSRVKFWLGVGCQFQIGVQRLLSWSGLLPIMPPTFGWRTMGHYNMLQQLADKEAKDRNSRLHEYFRSAHKQCLLPKSQGPPEEPAEKPKFSKVHYVVR